ncbi:hypothetical protein D915_003544 [Fasciola hepatica]|uniref:Uncharacterized protein n=1 Tax=Fasciola hepatica TaxID=6192 RepID=A0A4E0RW82_FASHE|nr:hypothetical protein D915_003544 [Fasciola hepatica]
MSAALDCHQLRHYSDFETGSESGVSDLSYVHPYQPKKSPRRNKPADASVQRASRRGARATRRQNNEAFLSSLTVIAETDLEEASRISWPDSISHCSAFTKLFEDQSIRAIWDTFIALSEADQIRLLGSFYDRSYMNHSDVDLTEVNEDYPDDNGSNFSDRVKQRGQTKTRSRRSHRGAASRKLKSHSEPGGDDCLGSGSFACVAAAISSSLDTGTMDQNGYQPQLELRDSLCRRFANLLSKPHNPFPINGRRKHNRRIRRAITSLDLCLIHRVETELRGWFNRPETSGGAGDSRQQPKRWTPTMSLVGRSEPKESAKLDPSDSIHLLCLDSFERLLVHSVANYLGLFSYSSWCDKLGERQLWVELRVGQPFRPPERTFVSLIETRIISST